MSFNFKDAQLSWFDQDQQVATKLRHITFGVVNISPGAVAANSTVNASVTFKGLRAPTAASGIEGDVVLVWALGALPTGIALGMPITTAANTATVPFINPTAAPQTPAAANYAFAILSFANPTGLDS